MPMLFLGDSEAYLGTAIWNRIPSDRSFVYGYLLLPLAVIPGSLRALLFAHATCAVASAALLAAVVLEVSPGRRALAAAIALAWVGLEPLSLFWERYVMAESVALPIFAASVLFGLRYLSRGGFGWLAAANLAAAAVMTLRLPYVGMCWLGAVALPALAARRGRGRIAVLHALASIALVGGLQLGYRALFASLAGGDPAFQRADGLFLLSAWAPLLEAGDFPDRAQGESLLRLASVCLVADRRTREQQRWRDGCLVPELLKVTRDEDEANEVAEAAARSVARRRPLGIARLALASWSDFFDAEQLDTVMQWDRSPWEYPVRVRAMLAERFGLDGEAMPRASTPTNRWFFRSMPWLMLLAASPALAWCACALRILRGQAAVQAAWVAIVATGLLSITVVAATSPIPRYLHALGWLSGAWIAELLDPGQRDRRAAVAGLRGAGRRAAATAACLLLAAATGCRPLVPTAFAGDDAATRPASTSGSDAARDALRDPSPGLAGPASPRPSPVLAATLHAWETMAATRYDHRERVDREAGTYFVDCVGATTTFLGAAAPRATAELREAARVRKGFVPSPAKYARFLEALPAGGSASWRLVEHPRELEGGEILVVPPPEKTRADGSRAPGHAMIAAGPAEPLRDGSYALLVFDSTGTPHGATDSRLRDPRNLPLPGSRPPRPSGLGKGTVQLVRRAGREGWFVRWTVGGTRTYGPRVVMARPLA
jgi:hypothetical protein